MELLDELQSLCDLYPVTFIIMLAIGVVCFIPSALLLTAVLRSSIHPNCRALMCLWVGAQLFVYITVGWLAVSSILQQDNFFNENASPTEMHMYILKWYIPIWITSTCFELGISLERGISIYKPLNYHGTPASYPMIFLYFVFTMVFGFRVGTWIPSGSDTIEAAMGTFLSNLMDIGAFTTNVVVLLFARRRNRAAYKQLNERYQIRESFLIARAMMPVYCLSTALKIVIIIVNWLYVAALLPQTVSEVLYLGLSEICCGLTAIMFLLHHTRLRSKLDNIIGHPDKTRTIVVKSREGTIDNHFRMLADAWS